MLQKMFNCGSPLHSLNTAWIILPPVSLSRSSHTDSCVKLTASRTNYCLSECVHVLHAAALPISDCALTGRDADVIRIIAGHCLNKDIDAITEEERPPLSPDLSTYLNSLEHRNTAKRLLYGVPHLYCLTR